MRNGTSKAAKPQLALPGIIREPHVRRCALPDLTACLERARLEGFRPQITARDVGEYVIQFVPMEGGNREAREGQGAAKKKFEGSHHEHPAKVL